MIISDKFVFIHNPRTGGAFVRRFAKKAFPNSKFSELHRWHDPVDMLPHIHDNKLKFGIIRNPWAWYVSWYFHQQPHGNWLRFILQNQSNTFENFITTVLSKKFAKTHRENKFFPVGNPYAKPNVPVFDYMARMNIGFFTYRYIYMFFRKYNNIFYNNTRRTFIENHDKLMSLDCVCKNENLANDLIEMFKEHNIPLTNGQQNLILFSKKHNITKHKPYMEYYSDATRGLVRQADGVIINKYGYRFGDI